MSKRISLTPKVPNIPFKSTAHFPTAKLNEFKMEKKNVFLIIFNNLKDVSLLLFDAPKKEKRFFFLLFVNM